MPGGVTSLGLDLGSTRIKAGLLDADGALVRLESCDAPPLRRDGAICEGDADAYVAAATGLLEELNEDIDDDLIAGLSCQRSSFILEDADGRAITPLVSWQDTRAAEWCRAHRDVEPEFHRLSGLMLSAHYVGPKLAAMASNDPSLAGRLRDGELRLRTLDALLIESWGGTPTTDPSMAARTGLFDIERLQWSEALCALFGVHLACLPRVRPSNELDCRTPQGASFRTSLADQSAGLIGMTGADADTVLINLGTGGFVLRPIGETVALRTGYLTGILRADRDACPVYAMEGAISGCGPAIERYRRGHPELTAEDPAPELFAIPDGAGLGAPHWRPEIGVTFSRPEQDLDRASKHRALLEGLLFRVRDIYDNLTADSRPTRVALAGGLSADPFVARGLATLLGRAIDRIDAAEVTLRGAALAASPEVRTDSPAASRFESGDGAYLEEKYARWSAWLSTLLSGLPGADGRG